MKRLTDTAVLFVVILAAFWTMGVPSFAQVADETGADSAIQDQEKIWRGTMLAQKAFRSAAAKIEPCLVTIESFGGVSAVAGRIGGIRNQGEGNTTGVIISSDGYVITSLFNFIQQPPVITVVTRDGKRRVARLKGRDLTRKICILKIDDANDLPTPEMVDPLQMKVGQWAVSVGVGYGDANPAISSGIISATSRAGAKAIQTDANISPANYGGPLVDLEGRMLGLCVPLNPASQDLAAGVEWYDSGIGFAIPLYGQEKLIERLKNGETIEPAFLGVQTKNNPKGMGVQIENVINPSAAEKAELKKGDIITAIDEHLIEDVMALQATLRRYDAGSEITVTFRRKDEESQVSITLGDRPNAKADNEIPFPIR
jgi:serine protease Do